ncbi:MAG: hypothetical protein ACRDEA_08575 [Microcystaceae cyanobacterium]
MSELIVFGFNNQQVHCVGNTDKPGWGTQDVCAVLEIKRTREALSSFEPDEKGTVTSRILGSDQELSRPTRSLGQKL